MPKNITLPLETFLNLVRDDWAENDDGPAQLQSNSKHLKGQHIVVLDRGFIYVGDITVDGDYCRISNARNIRVWGTTSGLGELRNGPLSGTKLDVVGDVIAPVKSVIHYIACKGF